MKWTDSTRLTIIVLDHGQVTERGTHAQLMRARGRRATPGHAIALARAGRAGQLGITGRDGRTMPSPPRIELEQGLPSIRSGPEAARLRAEEGDHERGDRYGGDGYGDQQQLPGPGPVRT